tara:strand:- start:129 stop:365 length:237 start_codon:yes stop_codon:yes gene_type:complete
MARSVKKKDTKKDKKTKSKSKSKKNMKIAQLKEIIPGVLGNSNYKPGADPALDAVIRKLKKDGPGSLDSSGFGNRYKI